MDDAEPHRFRGRLQRQHVAVLPHRDELVLQVRRELVRLHQRFDLVAHTRRKRVALAAQPREVGRHRIADLPGRVERRSHAMCDLLARLQRRREVPQLRRGDGSVAAVFALVLEIPPHRGRDFADARDELQLLRSERHALLGAVEQRLDLREREAGQLAQRRSGSLRADQARHLRDERHLVTRLTQRGRKRQRSADICTAPGTCKRTQLSEQVGPVEEGEGAGGEVGRHRGRRFQAATADEGKRKDPRRNSPGSSHGVWNRSVLGNRWRVEWVGVRAPAFRKGGRRWVGRKQRFLEG